MDELPRYRLTTRARWRAWLAKNHETERGVWLVIEWKPGGRLDVLDLAVEEAVCFGWIDGTLHRLGDRRSEIRFTPRRPNGTWSRSNKERVKRLTASGAMAPAGLAAVARAKRDGSWNALDAVEALCVPADLAAALAARPAARRSFDAFSPSRKRAGLWWVLSAKRPETRQRRIAEVVRLASRGLSVSDPQATLRRQ